MGIVIDLFYLWPITKQKEQQLRECADVALSEKIATSNSQSDNQQKICMCWHCRQTTGKSANEYFA